MGVNQQTSVPAFTVGQVLTAQQQTEINTGVPVFADTTARDAAFGGTGEKVLAEGQMAYRRGLATWCSITTAAAGLLSGRQRHIAVFNKRKRQHYRRQLRVRVHLLQELKHVTVEKRHCRGSIGSSVITLPAGTYYVMRAHRQTKRAGFKQKFAIQQIVQFWR
jgi:hypothetical protein